MFSRTTLLEDLESRPLYVLNRMDTTSVSSGSFEWLTPTASESESSWLFFLLFFSFLFLLFFFGILFLFFVSFVSFVFLFSFVAAAVFLVFLVVSSLLAFSTTHLSIVAGASFVWSINLYVRPLFVKVVYVLSSTSTVVLGKCFQRKVLVSLSKMSASFGLAIEEEKRRYTTLLIVWKRRLLCGSIALQIVFVFFFGFFRGFEC